MSSGSFSGTTGRLSDTDEDSDSNSFSIDFEDEFDEDDLAEVKRKVSTPRPSLTEVRDILKHLDLDFIEEDLMLPPSADKSTKDKPVRVLSGARTSLNDEESDEKSKSPSPAAAKKFDTMDKRRKSQELKIDDSDLAFTPRGSVKETKKIKQQRRGKRYYVNQYLCYKALGKGSFGKVMLAQDITSKHKYAIKTINKSILKKRRILRRGKTPTNMLENIFREIAIMKKLDHPNIVKLYEVIDDPQNDKLYMVLEYMDKGGVLKNGGQIKCEPIKDLEVIRSHLRDMILGLDYLHRNNIIHADIKPDNLLVGPDGSLRIADFGVSYFLESTDGTVKKALGTPAFIAPECENEYFRAYPLDVWAMGVTLYMMITGICPFAGDTISETFDKIQTETPKIPKNIPKPLQNLLVALLTKDPKKRITVPQLMKHPWITKNGKEPLIHPEIIAMQVNVNEREVEAAVNLPSDVVTQYRRESQELNAGKQKDIDAALAAENARKRKRKKPRLFKGVSKPKNRQNKTQKN